MAKSTITDIWKDRKKIADAISSSNSPSFSNKKHCIIRDPKFHFEKVIAEDGYSHDQVFNADETGLWWRMTPPCSWNVTGVARASSFKKAKDRLTLLACSNAPGSHRLPLVFINKSAKTL